MDQKTALVTKNMIIKDVIEKFPISAEIMESYGLHCVGCSANTSDTVEVGAKFHGIPDEEITAMVNELNKLIEKGGGKTEKKLETPDYQKNPLTLTEAAANKLKSLLKEQGKPDYGLMVSVKSGGCSGYLYGIDLVSKPQKGDFVNESNGVRIFVDNASADKLQGITIDYVETLQASGFKFNNPGAAGSCGCGKSFN